ncbi:hypothetical protein STEG23_036933, partial [Scotinomys teguina]
DFPYKMEDFNPGGNCYTTGHAFEVLQPGLTSCSFFCFLSVDARWSAGLLIPFLCLPWLLLCLQCLDGFYPSGM